MAGSLGLCTVCVGIDAGTRTSKLGYSDSLSTRIITSLEGFDINALREGAEIFFDEPVFSCVIAIPENFSRKQREDVLFGAKANGFSSEVEIITAYDAMRLVLPGEENVLVCDMGASKTDFVILNHNAVIAHESVNDVCGNSFDNAFSEYLADLRLIDAIDNNLMHEAMRIKCVLSERESLMWHEREITRDDFERLIYFPVKRLAHTADKFMRVYRPKRIIMTGGTCNIPLVRKIFAGISPDIQPEFDMNLIVKGASLKAFTLSKENRRSTRADTASRIQEVRAGIIELEEILTRSQKDRLYAMFKQSEGMNDSGGITLMENLIREIKNASSR